MAVKEKKKPVSAFDAMKKNSQADRYVLVSGGRIKNNHIFRHLPWSQIYNEAHGLTKQQIKEATGVNSLMSAAPHLLYTDEMYKQAEIGKCDDAGVVTTTNRDHAKLIWREMRTIDPKCTVHPLSLPLPIDEEGNLTEAVDEIAAMHPDFRPRDKEKSVGK